MRLKIKESFVGNFMSEYPISVDPKVSFKKIVDFMADKKISTIIVMEEKSAKPQGILTERGILHYIAKEGKIPNIPIKDVIIQPYVSVAPDTNIVQAAKLMLSKKSRVLVFADKNKLVGIITAYDMLKSLKETRKAPTLDKVISTKVYQCTYGTSILDAAKILHTKKIGSILVQDVDSSYGIFTQRDVVKALGKKVSLNSKVGKYTSFPLITAKKKILANEAARIMITKSIKRLPLVEKDAIVGIVTARDVVDAYVQYLS